MEETLAKAGIFQGVDPEAALALGSQLETVDYARLPSSCSPAYPAAAAIPIERTMCDMGRHLRARPVLFPHLNPSERR